MSRRAVGLVVAVLLAASFGAFVTACLTTPPYSAARWITGALMIAAMVAWLALIQHELLRRP